MNKKDSYDIRTAIDNIKRIMEEKDIGQKEIESITGVAQSNISNILNKKKNPSGSYKFFSVEQLVALSSAWDMSVDELLGVSSPKKQEERELASLLTRLFEIDEIFPISLKVFLDSSTQKTCLYFDNDYLSQFLKTWDNLNRFATSGYDTVIAAMETMNYWRESVISQASNRPLRWNFRTEREQSEYISLQYIDYYLKNMIHLTTDECFSRCVCENVDCRYYESVEEMIDEHIKLVDQYINSSNYLNLPFEKQKILNEFCELQKIDQFFN